MGRSHPGDEDRAVDELLQALVASRPEGLREHRRPLGSFVRDDDGRLVAGIACHTQFGWLCIEKLWVDLSARGRHLGSRLLAAAEREAAWKLNVSTRPCAGGRARLPGEQLRDTGHALRIDAVAAVVRYLGHVRTALA